MHPVFLLKDDGHHTELQHGDDNSKEVYLLTTLKIATPVDLESPSKHESNISIQVLPTQETQHHVDGGLEAWSVIAGAFIALFVQCGLGKCCLFFFLLASL
jgi:hypothetical protein